eukprot:TRINITY_DN390_c0_g2_i2.p1 TRINITY_DN390_c0_g2~~TRINITY_DN390_c0_g2_i2.p1  ORF type:complete len:264 (-),score=79.17 TRINITY_DN390_c0_g2_i2:92-787(-)
MAAIARVTARRAASALCQRSPSLILARSKPLNPSARFFSAAASGKVAKCIQAEIKHEEEQYEQAKEIKKFLKDSPFKLVETDGDVNMCLQREMDDKVVKIEWQLTSPFDPDADADGDDVEPMQEAVELSVTVEKKGGSGMMFFCSTQPGEEHRYVIGNVKCFQNEAERDSISSYNGPEFEDLDDKLQESFDEYLAELGMSSEVCDFIDAMAVDKEQREYVNWLKGVQKFMS